MEELKRACKERGTDTEKKLARMFRIMDKDRGFSLSLNEFIVGINRCGLSIGEDKAKELFAHFDKDKSGTVSLDEFLLAFQPPTVNEKRKEIILLCFKQMDKTKDGRITAEDLKRVYKVQQHPKYLNGEWTEKQVFKEFLDNLVSTADKDGIITLEEFMEYYSTKSAAYVRDEDFEEMMRNSFKV